jgi:chromosome segregation ATPase
MEQFRKLRKGVVEATERIKERYHEEMGRYEKQTQKRLEQRFREQLERLAEQVDHKQRQILRRDKDIDELERERIKTVKQLELTEVALKDKEDHLLQCKIQIDKLKKEIKQKKGELFLNSKFYLYYSFILIYLFYVDQENEELMERCQKIYNEELREDVVMNDKVSFYQIYLLILISN